MPQTKEIEASRWREELREFSAVHEGWLIRVEVLSPALGAQLAIDDLPLLDIMFEPADGCVTIAAGAREDHVAHRVAAPSRVWVERTDAGADAALEIDSADGTRTILRLKTAVLPETVDGLPRGAGNWLPTA